MDPMAEKKALLVLTTVAKKSDATKITKALLEKKLAACVTTLPQGESRYVWKGKLCVEKEYLLIIKTLSSAYRRLETALKKIHPYDCPEIVGIDPAQISKSYRTWLVENVK